MMADSAGTVSIYHTTAFPRPFVMQDIVPTSDDVGHQTKVT